MRTALGCGWVERARGTRGPEQLGGEGRLPTGCSASLLGLCGHKDDFNAVLFPCTVPLSHVPQLHEALTLYFLIKTFGTVLPSAPLLLAHRSPAFPGGSWLGVPLPTGNPSYPTDLFPARCIFLYLLTILNSLQLWGEDLSQYLLCSCFHVGGSEELCGCNVSVVTDVGLGTLQVFVQVLLSSGSPPEGVSSPSSTRVAASGNVLYGCSGTFCACTCTVRGGVAAHPSPLVTLLLCYKYSGETTGVVQL